MTFLFYIFAALALVGGIGVVLNKNPVSSAFAMIVSFLGLAALFIQLDAYLVGILQILVYAGAIMVLFLFIIMLLDVEVEEKRAHPFIASLGAAGIAGGVTLLVLTVLKRSASVMHLSQNSLPSKALEIRMFTELVSSFSANTGSLFSSSPCSCSSPPLAPLF